MGKIDTTDMKILDELMRDASLSVPKLSKKINVNTSVVYSRIKRLVRRRLIKRFTVEVNEENLGYIVTAVIGLNIDAKLRDEILDMVMNLEEARDVFEVTGRFDLLVKVKARSLDELHEAISKIGKTTGVTHSETFIQMQSKRIEPRYTLPKT